MKRLNNVHMIVAINKKNQIGKDKGMMWHVSEELAHFKRTTMGTTLVMGRTTYESIKSELDGRRIIVLSETMNHEDVKGDVFIARSVDDCMTIFERQPERTFMIAGGATIYEAFHEVYSKAIVSILDNEDDGDTDLNKLNDLLSDVDFSVESKTPYQASTNFVVYNVILL